MNNRMRNCATVAALSLGMLASTLPAFASTSPRPAAAIQDHDDHDRRDRDRDVSAYRNNRWYTTGNREGYQDYRKHNKRPDHDHKYRGDDDRRAHDYGYEQGYAGHRGWYQGEGNPHR